MRNIPNLTPEMKEKLDKMTVKAQNQLVSARFKYSQCQLDIMFYLLTVAKDEESTYVFPIKNITDLTGRKWEASGLQKNTAKMLGNVLSFVEDDNKWRNVTMFNEISYNHGTLTVVLTQSGIELFRKTKEQFTYIELKSALTLTNKFSKRLYWLCCQWQEAGQYAISLEDFRVLMDLTDDETGKPMYAKNGDLKILIEKCIKEINAITDINISVDYKYTVRTISLLVFHITKGKQMKLPLDETDINYNISLEKQKDLNYMMRYGLSEDQAMEAYDKGCKGPQFGELLKNVINAVKNKQRRGEKLESHVAYIVSALQNAGYLEKKRFSLKKEIDKELARKKKKEKEPQVTDDVLF